jgi:hypothetical protein
MAGVPVTIVGEAFVTGLGVGGGPAPGGPFPSHPIAPGGPFPSHPIVIIPPGSIDPGPPLLPAHPIYIPIYPSHPIIIPPGSLGEGKPEHPIYLPPGIWGPTDPFPTHPIVIPPDSVAPGVPSHPIVVPPPPLGIWGGANEPFPTPPIFLPPDTPAEEREKLLVWHIGWTARTGWVVVATPGVPHPTPSAAPRP